MALQGSTGPLDDLPEIAAFARRALGGGLLNAEEIGNGNINRVFRARGASGAVIIKMAVPFVRRAGLGWPLSVVRLSSEVAAYRIHGAAAPGVLPTIIDHDARSNAVALEDLVGFEDWRGLLLQETALPGVGAEIGRYVAAVYLDTSPLTVGAVAAAEMRASAGSPVMHAFTDRMMFVAPFHGDPTNRCSEPFGDALADLLGDPAVRSAERRARATFLTRGDCLMHGDLHTGSVMASATAAAPPRVIDLEFAAYGPVAFDLGVFLAHLAIARARFAVLGRPTMVEHLDVQAQEFWRAFMAGVSTAVETDARGDDDRGGEWAMDAALFAGIEILRRTTGYFGVSDLETLAQAERRDAEHILLDVCRTLLTGSARSFDPLWASVIEVQEGIACGRS